MNLQQNDVIIRDKVLLCAILQQLTPQCAACAGEGEVGKLLIVQRVAQDEDVRHKEDGQLDRHAAGVERAFFGTAQKHDIGQCCAGGVAVVGEQDDLGTVLPGQMQRVHHIPRCAGVGDKDHDVLGTHQAGGDGLHVAVACRAELGGEHREPRPDVAGQYIAAALPEKEDLPCPLQKRGRAVHRLGVQCAAGAVQCLDGGVVGVGAERLGVDARLQLERDRHRRGRGLCQRDLHLVIAVKAQGAAETENRSLCHTAGFCQR